MRSKRIYLNTILLQTTLIFLFTGFAQARFIIAKFPNASNFTHPKDNAVLLKTPGLTYVYQTENKDSIITNTITTTFNTITVQGIRCEIIYDIEWTFIKKLNKKFITAETYNIYAWDNKGNVWEFGKDSFIYMYNNNWRFTGFNTKASWLAGKNGKLPRIIKSATS